MLIFYTILNNWFEYVITPFLNEKWNFSMDHFQYTVWNSTKKLKVFDLKMSESKINLFIYSSKSKFRTKIADRFVNEKLCVKFKCIEFNVNQDLLILFKKTDEINDKHSYSAPNEFYSFDRSQHWPKLLKITRWPTKMDSYGNRMVYCSTRKTTRQKTSN